MRRRLCSGLVLLAAFGWTAPQAFASGAEPSQGRPQMADAYVSPGVPHPGSDQILWVPTFSQAEEVARQTGRTILVMGSVGDWDGY